MSATESGPAGLLVLCPLEIEARAVRRALKSVPGARVRTIGPGPEAAQRAVESLDESERRMDVILAGLAGGLFRTTGQLVHASRVIDEHGNSWVPPIGPPDFFGKDGVIVGTDEPATTLSGKARLGRSLGAHAVDCESHAFAAAADRLKLRWGVHRAIADGPGDRLPSEVGAWVDQRGRTRLTRVLIDIARGRASVRWMRHLANCSRHALDALKLSFECLPLGDATERPDPTVDTRPDLRDLHRWGAETLGFPEDTGSVLLFGGSFDPPHRGHIELAIAARDALGINWLTLMPVCRSPHKAHPTFASYDHRLRLTLSLVRSVSRVGVSGIESILERDGPSYTVQTLDAIRHGVNGELELRLLIGADQAAAFHRWKDPRDIIELAEPAVMLRAPADSLDDLMDAMRPHWSPDELEAWRSRVVDVPMIEVSSTEIRDLLLNGGIDSPRLRELVPEPVVEYIREHALYGSGWPRP
ncbi:MAG: nicotinate (nicotinamide) nucleotide adenylyltransferase [Planctomycetota bacterium]